MEDGRFSLREVTEMDLPVVLEIEYRCFPDPYPISLLHRLMLLHPDTFYVAEVCGKVVGYVIGALRWGATGHILAIGVDPDYRCRGIGSALMQKVMEKLVLKGSNVIRLEVRKSNIRAQRFYQGLGFRKMEELPYYYEDGETAIAMEIRFRK
ncbi:MAG: ribosomal protein S18-alanine N-acetyltransferase [Candidatus Hadarchaeales archaeon]